MANIAGTLSIAKQHPLSITTSATNNGVAVYMSSFTKNAPRQCD
jgi:hypothetical protein